MFTLDQVRCFVAVAEELHFGRAAERLQMTQPPLSRQIQKLERSMRVQLFERTQRRVLLTPAGEVFLRASREMLALAEQAPQSTLAVAEGFEGNIQLGFTAGAAIAVLGDLLAQVSDQLPKVHLELSEMVTGDQVAALKAGQIDLGIARPPFDSNQVESKLILAEDLVLVVPEDSEWGRDGGGITEAQLKSLPVIMNSPIRARYFYDLIVRKFSIDHHKVAYVVTQVATVLSLVRAGRGVAFVPASTRMLMTEGVRYVDLGAPGRGAVELYLVWSSSNSNPALRRALSILK